MHERCFAFRQKNKSSCSTRIVFSVWHVYYRSVSSNQSLTVKANVPDCFDRPTLLIFLFYLLLCLHQDGVSGRCIPVWIWGVLRTAGYNQCRCEENNGREKSAAGSPMLLYRRSRFRLGLSQVLEIASGQWPDYQHMLSVYIAHHPFFLRTGRYFHAVYVPCPYLWQLNYAPKINNILKFERLFRKKYLLNITKRNQAFSSEYKLSNLSFNSSTSRPFRNDCS